MDSFITTLARLIHKLRIALIMNNFLDNTNGTAFHIYYTDGVEVDEQGNPVWAHFVEEELTEALAYANIITHIDERLKIYDGTNRGMDSMPAMFGIDDNRYFINGQEVTAATRYTDFEPTVVNDEEYNNLISLSI